MGEDARSGAVSSIVHDPLTGSAIRKLSYNGIEVSARLAYERVNANAAGIFLIRSCASPDTVFSANPSSRVLTVVARATLTVSSIFRDPRSYQPRRCSMDGCFPTGTIRYYVTVNGQDYVFVWPGSSVVNCGK
jgi:hypothetical protein